MNLEEMKLAVCLKLPKLILVFEEHGNTACWRHTENHRNNLQRVDWKKEGFYICHEAEKLLNWNQRNHYQNSLLAANVKKDNGLWLASMPYEIRLECLCRIWWPEKFKQSI